jgi:hypothetical protein
MRLCGAVPGNGDGPAAFFTTPRIFLRNTGVLEDDSSAIFITVLAVLNRREEPVRKNILAVLFLSICPLVVSQQALNNDSVIKLVKAGLSDDLIVSTITASAGNYDSSAEGIIALKTAGASDKVVAAVVSKAAAPVPIPTTAPATPPPPPASGNPGAAPASAAITAQAPAQPAAPPPTRFHSTDGKIRIYVTDHPIFESNTIVQGFSASGHTQAGDDPRTVELQADIQRICPAFILASNNPERADYVLVFRRRGGSRSSMFAFGGLYGLAFSATMKVDNASLFENNGDMLYSTKTTTVENAIRDICGHIPAPGTTSTPASVPSPPPSN